MSTPFPSYRPPDPAPYPTPNICQSGHVPIPLQATAPVPFSTAFKSRPPEPNSQPFAPPTKDATSRFLHTYRTDQAQQSTYQAQLSQLTSVAAATGQRAGGVQAISPAPQLERAYRHCQRLLDLAQDEKNTEIVACNSSWTERYKPRHSHHVCGNQDHADHLVQWLERWKLPGTDSPAATAHTTKPPVVMSQLSQPVGALSQINGSSDSEVDIVNSDSPKVTHDTTTPLPPASHSRVSCDPCQPTVATGAQILQPTDPSEHPLAKNTRSARSRHPSNPDGLYRYNFWDPMFDDDVGDATHDDDFKPRKWSTIKRCPSPSHDGKRAKRPKPAESAPNHFSASVSRPSQPSFPLDERLCTACRQPSDTPRSTKPSNLILITGPVGSGKTAAIMACAHQCGYQVLEVNAGTCRSGKALMNLLGEVTQSHIVRGISSKSTVGQGGILAQLHQNKPKRPPPNTLDRFLTKQTSQLSLLNATSAKPVSPKQPFPTKNTLAHFWKPKDPEETKPAAPLSPPRLEDLAERDSESRLSATLIMSDQSTLSKLEAMDEPSSTLDTGLIEATLVSIHSRSSTGGSASPNSRLESQPDWISDLSDPPSAKTTNLVNTHDQTIDLGSTRSVVSTQSSRSRQLLILIEEVDIVFDDDRGFLTTLQTLARKSKRPIILTSNAPLQPGVIQELGITEIITFEPPSPWALAPYLALLAYAHGVEVSPPTLFSVCVKLNCDIRKCLNQVELYVRSSSSPGKAPQGDRASNVTLRNVLETYLELVSQQSPSHDNVDPSIRYPLNLATYCDIVQEPSWVVSWPLVPANRPIDQCLAKDRIDDWSVPSPSSTAAPDARQLTQSDTGNSALTLTGSVNCTTKRHAQLLTYQRPWHSPPSTHKTINADDILLQDLLAQPPDPLLPPLSQVAVLEALAQWTDHRSVIDTMGAFSTLPGLIEPPLGTQATSEVSTMADELPLCSVSSHHEQLALAYYGYLWSSNDAHLHTVILETIRSKALLGGLPTSESVDAGHEPAPLVDAMQYLAGATKLYAQTLLPRWMPHRIDLEQLKPTIRLILFFAITMGVTNPTRAGLACDVSSMLRQVAQICKHKVVSALAENNQRAYRRAQQGHGPQLLSIVEPFLSCDPCAFRHDLDDPFASYRYQLLRNVLASFTE